MKPAILLSTLLLPLVCHSAEPELLSVRRIWDQAPHNAFTDLCRFHDRWICAFRESAAHVGGEGGIRVIGSADGEKWSSLALLRQGGADLRDPKLSITPDDRLMLNGVAWRPKDATKHQSLAWFSKDGVDWAEKPIGEPNVWIWRAAWHKKTAWAVGYGTVGRQFARLYSSPDGVEYKPVVQTLAETGFPNEPPSSSAPTTPASVCCDGTKAAACSASPARPTPTGPGRTSRSASAAPP